LTCCVLFAAFETFQNHAFNSHNAHLQRNTRGFSTLGNHRSTFISDLIRNVLVPNFQRLGTDACAFSDDCCMERVLQVPSFFNLCKAYECMNSLLKCIFRATTEPTIAKKVALKKLKGIMPEYLKSLDIHTAR
jgi:hypothetical protein